MLETRFIRDLRIDWSKIPEHSYLRSIPALSGLARLEFSKNITFFVGENGASGSHCGRLRLQSGGRHDELPFFHL